MIYNAVRISRYIFCLIAFRNTDNSNHGICYRRPCSHRFLQRCMQRTFRIDIKRLEFKILLPCCIRIDPILRRNMLIEITENARFRKVLAVNRNKSDPIRFKPVIQIDPYRDTFQL